MNIIKCGDCPFKNLSNENVHKIIETVSLEPNINKEMQDPNEKKIRKFLGGIELSKKSIDKLLNTVIRLCRCNCGLIFGITANGNRKNILKLEAQ